MEQCSTCQHWKRLTPTHDAGDCGSEDERPEPGYGHITLESDGCKHWTIALALNKANR